MHPDGIPFITPPGCIAGTDIPHPDLVPGTNVPKAAVTPPLPPPKLRAGGTTYRSDGTPVGGRISSAVVGRARVGSAPPTVPPPRPQEPVVPEVTSSPVPRPPSRRRFAILFWSTVFVTAFGLIGWFAAIHW